jgi:hypothetical protein
MLDILVAPEYILEEYALLLYHMLNLLLIDKNNELLSIEEWFSYTTHRLPISFEKFTYFFRINSPT